MVTMEEARIGAEIVIIPLAKLPDDIREREKAPTALVWE